MIIHIWKLNEKLIYEKNVELEKQIDRVNLIVFVKYMF